MCERSKDEQGISNMLNWRNRGLEVKAAISDEKVALLVLVRDAEETEERR